MNDIPDDISRDQKTETETDPIGASVVAPEMDAPGMDVPEINTPEIKTPVTETATAPESVPASAMTDDLDGAARLAEAFIFAAAEPVTKSMLQDLLGDLPLDAVIHAVQMQYAGRGVELVAVGGGWQFRSAPDLASKLRRVVQVPRRLPKAAMETLAVIAYHQPVTRSGIEEVRGVSLSQSVLDGLLEAGLISSQGRKDVPGRPTLWGTTPAFLAKFGLNDLRDLPRREDLILENTPDALPAALAAAPPDVAATPDSGEEHVLEQMKDAEA